MQAVASHGRTAPARRVAALLAFVLAVGVGTGLAAAARHVQAHKHGTASIVAVAPAGFDTQSAGPRLEQPVDTASAPSTAGALRAGAATADSYAPGSARTADSAPARGPPGEALA